jgi:hypothetical protein
MARPPVVTIASSGGDAQVRHGGLRGEMVPRQPVLDSRGQQVGLVSVAGEEGTGHGIPLRRKNYVDCPHSPLPAGQLR